MGIVFKNPKVEMLIGHLIPEEPALGLPALQLTDIHDFINKYNKHRDFEDFETEIVSKFPEILNGDQELNFETLINSQKFRYILNNTIAAHILSCYYSLSGVRNHYLGTDEAPFPIGQKMPENNYDLLESVWRRGKIYFDDINSES